jgi:hypothetical protein
MRKRRTCFEQTLPEDCEDFFRKVGDFGRKSVAEIRFCAMHQYGASVPSISAND